MNNNNHHLPINAYYDESGAIIIRKSPKDAEIQELRERVIQLEQLVNELIRNKSNELPASEPV
jgi:hypothetical protein